MALAETIKHADWQKEKHVPVVECPDQVKAGEVFAVKAWLGKGVSHPNTTEHHINTITLYFLPEGASVPFQVGQFNFSAHGESAKGPNEGPVYTDPSVAVSVKLSQSGTFIALSLCNIHGLWEGTKSITVA